MSAAALRAEPKRASATNPNALYEAAEAALRKTKLNSYAARIVFHKVLMRDDTLLTELELKFLQQVEDDIRNGRDAVVGHENNETQHEVAYQNSVSNGGGGHKMFDAQAAHASEPFVVSEHYRKRPIARLEAAQTVAITVFDSFRVRDGRSIGKVRWYELGYLSAENKREAAVLDGLRNMFAMVPDDSMTVEELVRVDALERLIQKAAEVEDTAREKGKRK